MLQPQTKEIVMEKDEVAVLKEAIHALWIAISKEPVDSDGILIRGLRTLYPALENYNESNTDEWSTTYAEDIAFAKNVLEACRQ